jgi:hypothetical protein
MVDLVRSGRTPEELAREFEPTAQSISAAAAGAANVIQANSDCAASAWGPECRGRVKAHDAYTPEGPATASNIPANPKWTAGGA